MHDRTRAARLTESMPRETELKRESKGLPKATTESADTQHSCSNCTEYPGKTTGITERILKQIQRGMPTKGTGIFVYRRTNEL